MNQVEIKKPTYPKLTCKQDKRFKLCDDDIDKAYVLRKKGFTYQKIANLFKMSASGIFFILNPKCAKISNEQCKKNNKIKYNTSKKFRDYQKKQSILHIKNRRKTDIDYRKYEYLMKKINRINK